jgi:hypothetical protein
MPLYLGRLAETYRDDPKRFSDASWAVCQEVTQKERKILAGVTVADLAKRRRQSK